MDETNYCPYCGYTGILKHGSGTCTCLKCHKSYYILAVTGEKLYWDEMWVQIKGFENLYEISNYLRIRSIPPYDRRKDDSMPDFEKLSEEE